MIRAQRCPSVFICCVRTAAFSWTRVARSVSRELRSLSQGATCSEEKFLYLFRKEKDINEHVLWIMSAELGWNWWNLVGMIIIFLVAWLDMVKLVEFIMIRYDFFFFFSQEAG